jgi:hypothetical protein
MPGARALGSQCTSGAGILALTLARAINLSAAEAVVRPTTRRWAPCSVGDVDDVGRWRRARTVGWDMDLCSNSTNIHMLQVYKIYLSHGGSTDSAHSPATALLYSAAGKRQTRAARFRAAVFAPPPYDEPHVRQAAAVSAFRFQASAQHSSAGCWQLEVCPQ